MFELRAHELVKLFDADGRLVRAVDGVSLTIDGGDTLGLVGESGCGKSTLGQLLLGLLSPTSGSVEWNGRPLTSLSRTELMQFRRETAVVFQDPFSSLDPRMSVLRIVEEPIVTHDRVRGKALRARALDLLDRVGIDPTLADRHPHAFSGGQRQRIAIARALAVQPKFVVFDEPTSALDVSVQAQVLNLVRELRRELNIGFVFISHNLPVVRLVADRLAVMYLGKIVETGDVRTYDRPLHPYTKALLASIPAPQPGIALDVPIREVDPPSAAAPPSGCRYHTRCPWAFEPCDADVPTLAEHAPGRHAACHLFNRAPEGASKEAVLT